MYYLRCNKLMPWGHRHNGGLLALTLYSLVYWFEPKEVKNSGDNSYDGIYYLNRDLEVFKIWIVDLIEGLLLSPIQTFIFQALYDDLSLPLEVLLGHLILSKSLTWHTIMAPKKTSPFFETYDIRDCNEPLETSAISCSKCGCHTGTFSPQS